MTSPYSVEGETCDKSKNTIASKRPARYFRSSHSRDTTARHYQHMLLGALRHHQLKVQYDGRKHNQQRKKIKKATAIHRNLGVNNEKDAEEVFRVP